jgi:polyisoprenoid-binding protein YceI
MGLFTSIKRNPVQWALGAVALVAVLIVGGVFVIHKIEGKSSPPLSLSTAPTVTTLAGSPTSTSASSSSSGDSSSVDGAWKVSSGSTAGYRIKESLFGVSNTAVGRTTAVTGSINIAGTAVTTGSFSVDLTKVTSDRSQRDGQFQGRIMDTSSFPTATFTLTQPIQLATLPADGVQITANATGNLKLHGVTKSVTFPVTARRSAGTIQVNGSIPITFADYNISNPSGGPATTGDSGTMEFLINFAH